MKDIDDAIATLRQKYAAAVAARNVAGLMQLYDPKVRVFDAWGVWDYSGVESWQIAVEGWLSSSPSDKFVVNFSDCRVAGDMGFATMTAIVHYAAASPDGAYFSDRGRPFQADRGRQDGVAEAALGKRAGTGLNVAQSSTISLKRAAVGRVSGVVLSPT